MELWQQELNEEETAAMIERFADAVLARKLEVPVIAMLELHKPLANVMGHAAVSFSPFIIPFVGFDAMNDYSRLFAKRANVERIIERLEEGAGRTAPVKQ